MLLLSIALIYLIAHIHGAPIQDANGNGNSNYGDNGSGDSETSHILYDQRQTGKYNIHVSIKDVAIIEVDQNEIADESYDGGEDYYYDDSDLTVKPIKFTTSSDATTTTTTQTSPSPTTSSPFTTSTSTGDATMLGHSTLPTLSTISTNSSTYSANLLADIAASRFKPSSSSSSSFKPSNLVIIETPTEPMIRGRARGGDEVSVTPQPRQQNIEYTPPQGYNSPIFKVKVQRTASPPPSSTLPSSTSTPMTTTTTVATTTTTTEATKPIPSRCRGHRDTHGKCHTKRSGGSVLKKLFSMLVSLPFNNSARSQQLPSSSSSAAAASLASSSLSSTVEPEELANHYIEA